MRPASAALAAFTALLLLSLTACAADDPQSPTATSPAASTPSAAPVASGPLTCDELAPADLVAAALEGADGVPVEPVPATHEMRTFDAVLLEGAGGLPCSWRVGSGMPEYNAPSDWAYLRVDVLPGAGPEWVPLWGGDAPSSLTREIAGFDASVSGGDPGWAMSARVGDHWVVVSLSAAALTSTGGRFLGLDAGVIMDRLAEVAGAAFTAVGEASPERLAWPTVELRQNDPICRGGLAEPGVVSALGLPVGSPAVEYAMTDATAAPPTSFDDAVRAAARVFGCEVRVDGMSELSITAARGFAPLYGRFLEPDADVAFAPIALADAPPDAEAVGSGTGRASIVYLDLAGTIYRIDGEGAPAVAQAIVAQTY